MKRTIMMRRRPVDEVVARQSLHCLHPLLIMVPSLREVTPRKMIADRSLGGAQVLFLTEEAISAETQTADGVEMIAATEEQVPTIDETDETVVIETGTDDEVGVEAGVVAEAEVLITAREESETIAVEVGVPIIVAATPTAAAGRAEAEAEVVVRALKTTDGVVVIVRREDIKSICAVDLMIDIVTIGIDRANRDKSVTNAAITNIKSRPIQTATENRAQLQLKMPPMWMLMIRSSHSSSMPFKSSTDFWSSTTAGRPVDWKRLDRCLPIMLWWRR
jgi:hypothetical protein